MACFFLKTDTPLDMSDYAGGKLKFDIKVVSGDADITMKVDCVFPCTSGDHRIGRSGVGEWETIEVGVNSLVGKKATYNRSHVTVLQIHVYSRQAAAEETELFGREHRESYHQLQHL